jgi:hypothetical protein
MNFVPISAKRELGHHSAVQRTIQQEIPTRLPSPHTIETNKRNASDHSLPKCINHHELSVFYFDYQPVDRLSLLCAYIDQMSRTMWLGSSV